MRLPIFFVPLLACVPTAIAEEGFHLYKFPGHHGLPSIADTGFTVHQPDRVQPERVEPPCLSAEAKVGAPSDAIVLFDGTSMDQFRDNQWKFRDGLLIAGKGGLNTVEAFGDIQMHVEWRTPDPGPNKSKPGSMGNSGIFLMQKYELQVFDSYSCEIYADGSAGAIYGQSPPLVNVCRKPGQWQSYDIAFTAPVFDGETLISPARITVFHNGVLIQNNTEIFGPTRHNKALPYVAHPDKMPLMFQAHGSPVEYRNIWVRPL
ncbi:DUF1080 domain-containing protein [Crateriforma conspicua]|uniref:3-keto-alpha-glucoside-1,2-lyase/3-keto-2-hydroxy-glucal hydratase domain-containing protein n=1 Tax=Crateriforma conspicua TaxID=2527996 RepID=A0A5C6FN82_9PLAN|nr:DUF1080 domain-containing protein [Crateriforma conspicua]TWU61843.1 hypothetical protein V7x_35320 [Crateriforma conspicua]